MARPLNLLTARQVTTAKHGWRADGGGLYLRVRDNGARRQWIFRVIKKGERTEISLGGADLVNLKAAHEMAQDKRDKLAAGKDLKAEKRAQETAEARRKTFGDVAKFVIDRDRKSWGASSLRAWKNSLEGDAKRLAKLDVADIGVNDVKTIVMPMFDRGDHVAANRTLPRIEAVFDCADAHGWRSADNPASWRKFKQRRREGRPTPSGRSSADWSEGLREVQATGC